MLKMVYVLGVTGNNIIKVAHNKGPGVCSLKVTGTAFISVASTHRSIESNLLYVPVFDIGRLVLSFSHVYQGAVRLAKLNYELLIVYRQF